MINSVQRNSFGNSRDWALEQMLERQVKDVAREAERGLKSLPDRTLLSHSNPLPSDRKLNQFPEKFISEKIFHKELELKKPDPRLSMAGSLMRSNPGMTLREALDQADAIAAIKPPVEKNPNELFKLFARKPERKEVDPRLGRAFDLMRSYPNMTLAQALDHITTVDAIKAASKAKENPNDLSGWTSNAKPPHKRLKYDA